MCVCVCVCVYPKTVISPFNLEIISAHHKNMLLVKKKKKRINVEILREMVDATGCGVGYFALIVQNIHFEYESLKCPKMSTQQKSQ